MKFTRFSDGTNLRASTAQRNRAIRLNKYYTRPEIVRECSDLFERYLGPETLIIEPSAAGGAFLNNARRAIFAYDVAPDHPQVIERDFLTGELAPVFREIGDIAVLGNPPFGRRSSLAVAFLNRALEVGHTVGFILPSAFERWDTQRKVLAEARLIVSRKLPEDAFTLIGRPYRLQCIFQVWSHLHLGLDLRLHEAPPTAHPDFEIMEYCPDAPRSARHLGSRWDFAVRFQGHHDYRLVFSPEECDVRHHWMMFDARGGQALSRLLRIDFAALSRVRSVVPGFSRADVVERYAALSRRAA